MKLNSRSFPADSVIPKAYSKKGGNRSPALNWTGVPVETRSLVLIVDDPDAPSGLFTHWIVYGIDPETSEFPEAQPGDQLPSGGRQGQNGFGDTAYGGPQPPSGTHRYVFHLYALDTSTDLPQGLTRQEIDGAIHGHVIEEATMIGLFASEVSRRAQG